LLEGNTDESSVEILKTSSSKLRKVLEVLRDIQAKGEKTIVFARHKDVQRMLARVFTAEFGKPVRVINGDTPRATSLRKAGMETRKRSLEEFAKTEGFQVIVLSPFVAGVGLTIVEANHVIHYGRWWNPAVEAQATDRVYRIGQPREVHVYLPILEAPTSQLSKTFDQLLDNLIERKKKLAEGILNKDNFLMPQEQEEQAALEVIIDLEKANTSFQ